MNPVIEAINNRQSIRAYEDKLIPKDVLDTIIEAGRSALSHNAIRVTQFYNRKKKGETRVCSICGEAYPTDQGLCCINCQGDGYYRLSV